jgi:glycine cleavage system H lipoate-binding protein
MKTKASESARGTQKAVVYDMTGNLCVWSRAGVIKPTACMNAYDCLACPLDRKLKQDIAKGRLRDGRALAGWQVSRDMPQRASEQKKCRHMLSGLVSVKYCVNDYDCDNCAYYRMIEDAGLAEPLSRVEQVLVSGFAVARNYYYHEGHTWARVEYGGRVRMGLDDFASRLFGPVDSVELPRLGSTVGQGEPGFGMTRGGHAADCLSPVEGVVAAVNPAFERAGPVPMDAPYDEGWLMVIEPVRMKGNLRNLFFEEEGLAWMEDEAQRLTAMIAEQTGYRLAATGGRAIPDILGQVPGLEWDRLKDAFLHT